VASSHVDLEGNELADKSANDATKLHQILHCEQTSGAYSHLINTYFANQLRGMSTKHTSPRHHWYHTTTIPGLNILPNRLADTQLRRLRFWLYTKYYNTSTNIICSHCQQDFDPIHYLIHCPAHPAARQRLKHHLTPQQHGWNDRDIAALLIRKATIIPHIIMPLLIKDPYKFNPP